MESLWPIFRLHHQRSRYIYDLYYKREAISKDVYDYCLKNGYADGNLIAKWKKVCICKLIILLLHVTFTDLIVVKIHFIAWI